MRYTVTEVCGGVTIQPSLQGSGFTLEEARGVAKSMRPYVTRKGFGFEVRETLGAEDYRLDASGPGEAR